MAKLKLDHVAELDLARRIGFAAALSTLLPFPGARAVAFGTDHGSLQERYWFADIRRDGVRARALPAALTERFNLLADRTPDSSSAALHVRAFRLGDAVGLLVGSQEVHLYADIEAEPQVIAIDGHFGTRGEPFVARARRDSHWLPAHCGHADGNVVPVILHSPVDGANRGRHVALLEIDAGAGTARWRGLGADGLPRSPRRDGHMEFVDNPLQAGFRLAADGDIVSDQAPVLTDCAWRDGHWILYSPGFHAPHGRHGHAAGPCVLSRHRADLGMERILHHPGEYSLMRLCASGDRAIIAPLTSAGPAKGKAAIWHANGDVRPVTLPRGFPKHHVVEHGDGTWWMLPMPMGFRGDRVIACAEA